MPSIVVVGPGRSGTSLLQCILAAHPLIASLPETAILRSYLAKSSRFNEALSVAIDRIASLYPAISDYIDPNASIESFPQLFTNITTYFRDNGLILLDKDPRLIEHMSALIAEFPDLILVGIVRDPRDILASRKYADWSSKYSYLRQVIAVRYQFSCLDRFLANSPNTIHVLKYEHLVSSPRQCLLELCQYIGVDFHKDMLAHENVSHSLVLDHEFQWKSNVLKPISTTSISTFSSRLNRLEILIAEKALESTLATYGYRTTFSDAQSPILSVIASIYSYLVVLAEFLVFLLCKR